jgi:hypothetical protein
VRVTDHELHALLAGALDPGEAARLRARARHDPDLRARLAALRAETTPPGRTRSPTWFLPPPGRGTIRATTQREAVFGPADVLPGDVVRIRLVTDAVGWRAVVLRRVEGQWELVEPAGPDSPPVGPDDLEREEDAWILPIEAAGPPGLQRWAVVLMPAGWAPDWGAPAEARGEDVRVALAHARVPAVTVDVRVG